MSLESRQDLISHHVRGIARAIFPEYDDSYLDNAEQIDTLAEYALAKFLYSGIHVELLNKFKLSSLCDELEKKFDL